MFDFPHFTPDCLKFKIQNFTYAKYCLIFGKSQNAFELRSKKHSRIALSTQVEQYRRDSRVKKNRNLGIAFEEAKRYFVSEPSEKIRYWTDRAPGGRKPPRWPKILVVMRMYWKNLPMEYYDFRTREWSVLAEVQYWRSCSAVVSYGSYVYLVGGEEKDTDSPTGEESRKQCSFFTRIATGETAKYQRKGQQSWLSRPAFQHSRLGHKRRHRSPPPCRTSPRRRG